jgi:hypothetical protein
LRGYTLYYFKKKEDSKPKGEIDLRASVVDLAGLDKTARPYCIRIQQVSYTHTHTHTHTLHHLPFAIPSYHSGVLSQRVVVWTWFGLERL